MKTFKPPHAKSGAVMIFAVALLTAGLFVLAGVVQLAATQGLSGDAEWELLQRSVTLGNSRALAREYMLSRIFRGSVPADPEATSVSFSDSYGGFTLRPAGDAETSYWSAISVASEDVVLNINPFNLMERGGFYREVFVGELEQDSSDTVDWSFALRTRSPVAAGFSFVQHRPANNPLSEYASPPYIDMNAGGEQFIGYSGLPRMPVSSVDGVMTRGAGDANGYQGYLDVPEGAGTPNTSPFTGSSYQVRNTQNGQPSELQLVLDLSEPDPNETSPVVRYDVDSNKAEYVDANGVSYGQLPVTAIVLEGTDDELLKPLHIVVPESNTTLSVLLLSGDNRRRVYIYRANAAGSQIPFSIGTLDNASSFRIGITLSQCPISFEGEGLTIQGGIRTDGNINPSGIPTFVPETDPGGLDFIADRMMWLEDYRAQL